MTASRISMGVDCNAWFCIWRVFTMHAVRFKCSATIDCWSSRNNARNPRRLTKTVEFCVRGSIDALLTFRSVAPCSLEFLRIIQNGSLRDVKASSSHSTFPTLHCVSKPSRLPSWEPLGMLGAEDLWTAGGGGGGPIDRLRTLNGLSDVDRTRLHRASVERHTSASVWELTRLITRYCCGHVSMEVSENEKIFA